MPWTKSLAIAILAVVAILSTIDRAAALGCTVGTSSVVCLAQKTQAPFYRYVVIDNESTTATVACTDDGTTPVINAAGSYTFAPGATRTWTAFGVFFTGPYTCIASAAGAPVTVTAR